MAYYIGSDIELPLLPWKEKAPSLFIDEIRSNVDSDVIRHFSKKNIRYVGSHEGCGCGFRCGEDWFDSSKEDQNEDEVLNAIARQKSHEQLRNYLVRYCSCEKQIEIYGCWEGDWWKESLGKINIMVDDLSDQRFRFMEKHLYVVDMSRAAR